MWKKLVLGGIAGLALLSAPLAAEEKKGDVTIEQHIAGMVREGWTQVVPGVLQRSLGAAKTQTFAYGEGGLQWLVQEAESRFGEVLGSYKANPTEDGALAVEVQAEEVKRLRRALAELDPEQAERDFEAFLSSGCNVSYGANADAYPLTGSQGVGATANAYFWNDCGHVGKVYSYAYVEGKVNNVFTTSLQRDPFSGTRNGTNVSSFASRTLGATSQCYSYAEGLVDVPTLSIYLLARDWNWSCPPPPPSVSISGTGFVFLTGFQCQTVTWTASGSGGTPPYSFAWYFNGGFVGSGSSYSRTFCGSNAYSYTNHTLSVTLTDSASQTASKSKTVTVETEPREPREPIGPIEPMQP